MAQTARPISDISVGSWTDEGAVDNDGSLFSSLDEVSQDGDSSYVLAAGTNNAFEVRLGTLTDPNDDTNHVIHVLFRSIGSGGPERLQVDIVEGTTVIETLTNFTNRAGTYLDINSTLVNAANITDYTDLRVRCTSGNLGGGEELRVTQIFFTIPDAPSPPIVGTLSETLDDITLGASGTVVFPEITGGLSEQLDSLTVVSQGSVDVEGDLSASLDDILLSSLAAVAVSGSLSEELDSITISATGSIGDSEIAGSLDETLDAITLTSLASAIASGSLSQSIDNVTLESLGSVDVSGALDSQIGDIVLSSEASADVSGTGSALLDAITVTGEGIVGSAPVTGSLNQSLDNVTLSSLGSVVVDGSSSSTLQDLQLSSSGQVFVAGSLLSTLDQLQLSALGTVVGAEITGELDKVLDDITLDGFAFVGSPGQSWKRFKRGKFYAINRGIEKGSL